LTRLDIGKIFKDTSLYKEIDFSDNLQDNFLDLYSNKTIPQFDCFCIHCQKESTFKRSDVYINDPLYSNEHSQVIGGHRTFYWATSKFPIQLTFDCQRDITHKYSLTLITTNDKKMVKIGQNPSLASIEQHDIKKYRNILKRDYNDFSKAIGLVANGIGIGSFVYLRRIFENLIEENHQIAKVNNNDWDEVLYKRSKMNEKIKLLKEYLPEIIVKNNQLYGIISKGIHELDEDECKEMFPQIKLAIELILDEKIAKIEKEEKANSIYQFVQQKANELQKK